MEHLTVHFNQFVWSVIENRKEIGGIRGLAYLETTAGIHHCTYIYIPSITWTDT